MTADRLNEIRETLEEGYTLSHGDGCFLLAALDAAEQRADRAAARPDDVLVTERNAALDRAELAERRAAQAEQERDEAAKSWGSECRRGDAAEARLAETQEAARELLRVMDSPPTKDSQTEWDVAAAELRAALTTHPEGD